MDLVYCVNLTNLNLDGCGGDGIEKLYFSEISVKIYAQVEMVSRDFKTKDIVEEVIG